MSYIIQDILKLFIQEYVIMENATVVKSVKLIIVCKKLSPSQQRKLREYYRSLLEESNEELMPIRIR